MFFGEAGQHAVKDVIISLFGHLMHDARLFQEVLLDHGAFDGALTVEEDIDVLAEARRVVVEKRFSVPEGLENRISLENLLLDPRVLPADGRQVLQDEFGALGFARARLAADDDALILLRPLHQGVAIVSDGEDVRRQLADFLFPVQFDLLGRVNRQDLVRIHRDENGARVRVDEVLVVADQEVPEDAGLVKVAEADHVLDALNGCRVHGFNASLGRQPDFVAVIVDHLDLAALGGDDFGADGHVELAPRDRLDPNVVALAKKIKRKMK